MKREETLRFENEKNIRITYLLIKRLIIYLSFRCYIILLNSKHLGTYKYILADFSRKFYKRIYD